MSLLIFITCSTITTPHQIFYKLEALAFPVISLELMGLV